MSDYEEISKRVKQHWDKIAKPIDSLGMLEDYVVKICSIAGSEQPYIMDRKAVVCLCADHGVVEEGVTQTDSSVTRIVAENFAAGRSSVNHMAEVAGADVFAFDVGIACGNYPDKEIVMGRLIDRKIARGTGNLAKDAAMSIEECRAAIDTGVDIVGELKQQGYKLIATGEMGIGNTTPTSALAAFFLNLDAESVTGRGAGLSRVGITKKCQVVKTAVERVKLKYNKLSDEPGRQEVEAILAELGGFEIAAMVGVFLGGVIYGMPIMIDGAISSVAALVATKMDARVPLYAIPTHQSEEITGSLALREMGLEAMLHGRLCLGEGTGAVALMPLLDMAMNVYSKMGSFEDYDIEAYHRF